MTAVAEAPGEITQVPQTLYQKLLEAAKAIGVVEKDKRNKFHSYDYASIEGVVHAVRDELLDRDILLIAGEHETIDRQRSTNQGEATVTTIRLVFSFIDVTTGERLEIPWVGRGEDPADKGVSKALTDARKTFLIQQLNLERGDDTEADDATDQRSSSSGGTVNLTGLINGSGLTNTVLNQILVAANLPAHEKPYGSFARIPADVAENVRTNLEAAKAAKT